VSDLWYPAARRYQGAFANYQQGRNQMRTVICHYTVGVDSHGIAMRGTFHFLVTRDGEVRQYAPIDAVNWHVGMWNWVGPGIEVEYLPGHDDEVFTPAALDATAGLVHWLHTEHGFPLDYYDGPRIPDPINGFMAHRSVGAPDADHTDFWPREDWDRIAGDDMPLNLADFAAIFEGTADRIAGKNLDGSYTTNRQVIDMLAQIRDLLKAQKPSSTTISAPPLDVKAVARAVADEVAARMKD
jgi:hypothetical protein